MNQKKLAFVFLRDIPFKVVCCSIHRGVELRYIFTSSWSLWNLDKTNPTLFNELLSDFTQPSSVFDPDSEPEFVDVIEDTSDIPLELEVVQPIEDPDYIDEALSAQLRRTST